MKNKMSKQAIKNIILSIILIFPLNLNNNDFFKNNYHQTFSKTQSTNKTQIILLDKENKYCNLNCILLQNMETLEFLSNTFGIEKQNIIDDLIKIHMIDKPNINNIGKIKDKKGNLKKYNSFTEGLIEYMYKFVEKKPHLVSNKSNKFTGTAQYIIDLIKYYTGIYNNVDFTTAVSIAAAESGNFKVKYMLEKNNIYGGITSQGLIKYKNIEYGVLSYIRMLSKNYYGVGLNTIEKIGAVYCPEYINGKRTASKQWLNLVTKYMNKYKNTYSLINISDLKMNKP